MKNHHDEAVATYEALKKRRAKKAKDRELEVNQTCGDLYGHCYKLGFRRNHYKGPSRIQCRNNGV